MCKKMLEIKMTLKSDTKETTLDFYLDERDGKLGMRLNDLPKKSLKDLLEGQEIKDDFDKIRNAILRGLSDNIAFEYE